MKREKPKFSKPKEGEVYAFPLHDHRWGIGILARVETAMPRKPYGIFVYFYGPFDHLNEVDLHLDLIKAEYAIARLKTSALGIYQGDWTKLSQLPNWNKSEWPFPDFYLHDLGSGILWRETLDEQDLIRVVKRTAITDKINLQQNTSHGSLSATNHVSRLLLGKPSLTLPKQLS